MTEELFAVTAILSKQCEDFYMQVKCQIYIANMNGSVLSAFEGGRIYHIATVRQRVFFTGIVPISGWNLVS